MALVCAGGWIWTARSPRSASLESLAPEAREALLEQALHADPGAFTPAWFAPRIGYTLRPGRKLTAWDDTFTANALGYRTGPPPKAPGTFRVVFAGDSWTFGMGIEEGESFPRQFEKLARELGASPGRPVEAWSLALPGYNTLNEIAALEYFFPRLQPDAVVLCPCSNDMDTSGIVLPNGSLARFEGQGDEFGSDHSLVFREHRLLSFTFLSRWRTCFRAIRGEEERLAARKVPLLLYFTASWEEPFVHRLIAESGVESAYVVTPKEYTAGPWRNPPPFRHGTPAANRLYARMVYRGAAEVLGWPPPPAAGDATDVPVHRAPPPGDWSAASDRLFAEVTAKAIPERYLPGPGRDSQCAGPMDCATGLVGRATTVLIRRRPDARRVRLELSRLDEVAALYPLDLTIEIASPGGGTRGTATLAAAGPAVQVFELEIPGDLPVGAALDVALRADAAAISPSGFAPRAFRILSIRQR